jgi:hypothetical protein
LQWPSLNLRSDKAPYRVDPNRFIGASVYVPRFSIHVRQGKFSGTDTESVFDDNEAACKGAVAICADLGREIFTELKPGSDWQMDVTDESGDSVFQIRLYSWAME